VYEWQDGGEYRGGCDDFANTVLFCEDLVLCGACVAH